MKLFDCFIFNGELDLLEIRLNILYEYVDKFVILEGEETFTGLKKPLYLDENQSRFDKFSDKITYLVAPTPSSIPCPWSRESFHRNCLIEGVLKAHEDDFIILSDVDEIPNPSCFYFYLTRINEPFTLQLADHCFYLNCLFVQEPEMLGSVICRKSMITKLFEKWDKSYYGFSGVGFQQLRNNRKNFLQIPNAGWHYQNIMSDDDICKKLESFSHIECNFNEIKTLKNIQRCRNELIPINPSGKQSRISKIEINSQNTHSYIIKNLNKYQNYIK